LQLLNSKATHFQKTRKGSRWSRNQSAVGGLDMDAIVRHQPCKDQ